MKKILAIALAICMLCLAGGCSKKEEDKEKSAPSALVAYAAYRYEEGYQLAEGWMYDMTISAGAQLQELEELAGRMKLTIRDELFEHGRGYYLAFMDATGSVERHMLILEDGSVSRDGMIYDADGAQALLAWLDALRIEEQDVD